MPATLCTKCGEKESILWRVINEQQVCNNCYEKELIEKVAEEAVEKPENESQPTVTVPEEKKIRKSTRTTRYKSKNGAANNKNNSKKNRRNLSFKKPTKMPSTLAETHTKSSLFYLGQYFQVGDIVSMQDWKDDTYYAQIRGLLVSPECEKSAIITWLLPTRSSPDPNEQFLASTYVIGLEEDFARKISCMKFVCNAPSDYYYCNNTPYPNASNSELYSQKSKSGFIWSNI